MLSLVGTAVAINPDGDLRDVARERGWEIRDFAPRARQPDRLPSALAIGRSGGAVAAAVSRRHEHDWFGHVPARPCRQPISSRNVLRQRHHRNPLIAIPTTTSSAGRRSGTPKPSSPMIRSVGSRPGGRLQRRRTPDVHRDPRAATRHLPQLPMSASIWPGHPPRPEDQLSAGRSAPATSCTSILVDSVIESHGTVISELRSEVTDAGASRC